MGKEADWQWQDLSVPVQRKEKECQDQGSYLLRPRDTAYIINEWYHTNGNAILRYPNNEMCNYFPDVLVCYTDEDENTSHIWGNRRMHFIKDIK